MTSSESEAGGTTDSLSSHVDEPAHTAANAVPTTAEIHIDGHTFALAETFDRLPDLRCEIEQPLSHADTGPMPLIRAVGKEYTTETVSEVLAADPSTENVISLAAFDNEWLYRIDWTDRVQSLVETLVGSGGMIRSVSCEKGIWSFRLLFTDHMELRQTHDCCSEAGLRVDVRRIHRPSEAKGSRYGLTIKQRKSLAMAFEHGYYEVPRGASAQALASKRGVSHQALSEQLRRAHGGLVGHTIATDHPLEP